MPTKTATLPYLDGKEHLTIRGQGVEKRLIEKCIVSHGNERSRLKLFQSGELLSEPWMQWIGEANLLEATASVIDYVIAKYEQLERAEQLESIYNNGRIRLSGYRSFPASDVRCYSLRNIPYNDTAELTIYFHGDDPEKTKIKFSDDFNKITRQFAEFLAALHQCSFGDAIRCAKSIVDDSIWGV